jgi:hypothetical protein
MSIFQKASQTGKNLFKKGGSLDKGFSKISSGLDKTGSVLKQAGGIGNQIANVAQKITSNPLVQGLALAVAPEVAIPAFAAASLGESVLKKASQGAKAAGSGLKTASNITDVGSYKGSTLENLQDAKRRVDGTANSNGSASSDGTAPINGTVPAFV